jgi:hypothetical protein
MLHKVSWVWVAPPLATSLVVLAHPIIDPWHDGVAGLAPLVARNDVCSPSTWRCSRCFPCRRSP